MNGLKDIGGIPQTVRCDLGTENGGVEKIQTILNNVFNEKPTNKPAFLYGKSTRNQRIEAWWNILRKENAQFWMNMFEMLKDDNLFDGSFLDKALLQFCFVDIIQVLP